MYLHNSLYCLRKNKLSGLCPSSNTTRPCLNEKEIDKPVYIYIYNIPYNVTSYKNSKLI